jgi:uncharacterized protein (TIGR02117 family)
MKHQILCFSKLASKCIACLLALALLYLAAAALLSRILNEGEHHTSTVVDVWLYSNGVHVDVVVPTQSAWIDWRSFIDPRHTRSASDSLDWLAFGWGDKGFYLNTPEWKDLKAGTALRAVTGLGGSAMHTTYIAAMSPSASSHRFRVSAEQYVRLIEYLKSAFQLDEALHPIPIATDVRYANHDAFYNAHGRYTLFRTCNEWTNAALKSAGMPHCAWSPFAGGLKRVGERYGFNEVQEGT